MRTSKEGSASQLRRRDFNAAASDAVRCQSDGDSQPAHHRGGGTYCDQPKRHAKLNLIAFKRCHRYHRPDARDGPPAWPQHALRRDPIRVDNVASTFSDRSQAHGKLLTAEWPRLQGVRPSGGLCQWGDGRVVRRCHSIFSWTEGKNLSVDFSGQKKNSADEGRAGPDATCVGGFRPPPRHL